MESIGMVGKLNAKKLAPLRAGIKTADGGGPYAIAGPEPKSIGASCSPSTAVEG